MAPGNRADMQFFVWESHPGRKAAYGHRLTGADEQVIIDIKRGRSDGATLGDGATLKLKRPGELEDQLANQDRLVVVSPKVVRALEGLAPEDTALLPIAIQDANGEPLSTDYRIVHPHRVVDCIDKDASNLSWSKLEPDRLDGVYELEIDEAKLEGAPMLFRARHLEGFVFVREDVVDAIGDDVSGSSFTELDEFSY